MILKILSSLLFLAISITHLVVAYKELENCRKITKVFILFSLMLVLLSFKINNLWLYLALICSLIGDALLLIPSKKAFVVGACSFSLTHFTYLGVIGSLLPSQFNWCYYGILVLAGYLFVELIKNRMKKYMGKLTIPSSLYMYLILAEWTSALLLLIFVPSVWSVITFIGVTLFFVSDAILICSRFIKEFSRAHFYLMIFYISAQGCLLLSLGFLTK